MTKRHSFFRFGAVLTVALLLLSGAASCRRKAPPASPPADSPSASQAATAELESLRQREKDLEALLGELKEKTASVQTTVREELMGHLERLDGQGMYSTMEGLLLEGEEGHRELLGFFIACDDEHEKILTLAHDSHLVFPMLRLVARYPEQTAGLCDYIIRNTRENPATFVRREIYNFLPVFLNYHRGRYPGLRQLLKEDIVYQLTRGGKYLYKMSLAMRDLQFKPPIEAMLPILYNLEDSAPHGLVMSHLAGRGEEGLQALIRFVEKSGNSSHPSVSQVLIHIFNIAQSGRKDIAQHFIDHKDPAIRSTATFHYFRYPREATDLQRALDLLNSDVTVAQRILLLGFLKRKSPAIYGKLLEDPGQVKAEKARARLEKAAAQLKKEAGDEK